MNSLFGRHFTLFISCPFLIICFFFFFSSRRRHTRWPRDWSSDVCSSDLLFLTQIAQTVSGSGRPRIICGSRRRRRSSVRRPWPQAGLKGKSSEELAGGLGSGGLHLDRKSVV